MDVERGGKADRKNIWARGREEETGGWTRGEKMRRAKKGDGTERTSEKNGRKEKIK